MRWVFVLLLLTFDCYLVYRLYLRDRLTGHARDRMIGKHMDTETIFHKYKIKDLETNMGILFEFQGDIANKFDMPPQQFVQIILNSPTPEWYMKHFFGDVVMGNAILHKIAGGYPSGVLHSITYIPTSVGSAMAPTPASEELETSYTTTVKGTDIKAELTKRLSLEDMKKATHGLNPQEDPETPF